MDDKPKVLYQWKHGSLEYRLVVWNEPDPDCDFGWTIEYKSHDSMNNERWCGVIGNDSILSLISDVFKHLLIKKETD